MNAVTEPARFAAVCGSSKVLPAVARDIDAANTALSHLHALAWQPGKYMHATWWSALELPQWPDVYASTPACRRFIDSAIVKRRQFPLNALSVDINETERRLLAVESRLPALCTALGLMFLGRDDYLLLGTYRKILQALIGSNACDQLLMLKSHYAGPQEPDIAPEHIVDEAMRLGFLLLQRELQASQVWRALAIIFPPFPVRPGEADRLQERLRGPAVSMLFRLERFL